MNVDAYIRLIAGALLIVVALLSMYESMSWVWVSFVIGAILLQSAITGFCPMAIMLKKLGIKE